MRVFETKRFTAGYDGRERGWVHVHGPALVQLFRISDAICLIGGLWLATRWLQFPWHREQLLLALLAVACFMMAAAPLSLYRSWRAARIRVELYRLLVCCLTAIVLVMVPMFVLGPWPQQGSELLLAWGAITFTAVATGRLTIRLGLRAWRAKGRNFRTAAIVGATELGLRVADQLGDNPWMGIRLVGVFDERAGQSGVAGPPGVPLAGNLQALHRHVAQGGIDIVYIALPLRLQRQIQRVLQQLRDSTVSVMFVPDFSTYGLLHSRCDTLGGMLTVSLVDTPHEGVNGILKRLVDIVLASVALTVMALPMVAIAVAVKTTSPGPAIFAQRRYGLDGKQFRIYKFRTMTVVEDGESQFTFTQARKGDLRVSPIGAFLRRTSLDELPQLFNVLRGDMSLVGPRPHPVALNESHRKLIDGYMLRHKVRPGITGWAQVNGFRGETDTPEKMQKRVSYDLEYINDWSLWLDLKIIWKTMLMVLRDPNAF